MEEPTIRTLSIKYLLNTYAMMRYALLGTFVFIASTVAFNPINAVDSVSRGIPAPPDPERINIVELPLPPVTHDETVGGCTSQINSHRTGCIGIIPTVQNGNFLPDGRHIVLSLNFTGAPAAPDRASIYTGWQLIIIKTDGKVFPNGDPWKCITCGVPKNQQVGRSEMMDYPQAFDDGNRVLVGTNIVDCPLGLASPGCTPARTHIYPIRFNVKQDGSGAGGPIRELRVHPDNVHLGFSMMMSINGALNQFGYFGRLKFNKSPKTGIPLAPRYDLVNVYRLYNPDALKQVTVEGNQMAVNNSAVMIGELRGFSGQGEEVIFIGNPMESCNIDAYASHLTTGKIRRLTTHPEYVDPLHISRDEKWLVIMDTRGSNRQMWLAGMRGLPPVTDLVSSGVSSSTRNNGVRRFFQPYILDRYGDRGVYFGQQVNAAGDGSPGSINDPNWNGRADPRWSHDGTSLVYYQQIVYAPACGGSNPLPCPVSTAQGGRIDRVFVARFPNRKPVPWQPVPPVSDVVPWGVKYIAGSATPEIPHLPAGNYTLPGKVAGTADVRLVENNDKTSLIGVAITYHNYSDDGLNYFVGYEDVTTYPLNYSAVHIDWYSDISATGLTFSQKKTGPDGFHLNMDVSTNFFDANGTLTTTVNGMVYENPADYA
jgi:hypothetical protein